MTQPQLRAASISLAGLCVLAAIALWWARPASALVTCSGGASCGQSNADPKTVTQLPFTAPSHAATACSESDAGRTYPTLPFTHQGGTYQTLPAAVSHDYLTCTTAPTCTGSPPAHATLCAGDASGLTADTPRTLVASCGTAKCEYTCNSGYVQSGSACVPLRYCTVACSVVHGRLINEYCYDCQGFVPGSGSTFAGSCSEPVMTGDCAGVTCQPGGNGSVSCSAPPGVALTLTPGCSITWTCDPGGGGKL